MSEEIQIIQPMLGMIPFVLVQLGDVDADGAPTFDIRYGGGVRPQDVQEFLELSALAVGESSS